MIVGLQNKKKKYCRWWWGILAAVILVTAAIIINWAWICDWYRGVSYQPTDAMVDIRDALDLTSNGRFLFDAAQPALNDAESFNANCRKDESNIAVLGCYLAGNIYIYDVEAEELEGIREATAAHELLHAVWARTNEDKKKDLLLMLEEVYNDNLSILEEEVEAYDESERTEEIFVRVGTEITVLTEELEKYYGEVFNDRQKIVEYYRSYISVFKEIKERMAALVEEIEGLSAKITEMMEMYEAQADQLEADIVSFNSCAEIAGCFAGEDDFYDQRAALIARKNELVGINDQINNIINEYNEKVEEYNADVTESHKLQNMINSKNEIDI